MKTFCWLLGISLILADIYFGLIARSMAWPTMLDGFISGAVCCAIGYSFKRTEVKD